MKEAREGGGRGGKPREKMKSGCEKFLSRKASKRHSI